MTAMTSWADVAFPSDFDSFFLSLFLAMRKILKNSVLSMGHYGVAIKRAASVDVCVKMADSEGTKHLLIPTPRSPLE